MIIFGSFALVLESIGVYLKYFWMLYKVSGGWFRICLPACIWISLVWLCSRCVFGVMGVFSAVFYGFRNVFFFVFRNLGLIGLTDIPCFYRVLGFLGQRY